MIRPKLLIFDMDGLMFDTERISKPCWLAVAKEYGITMEDAFFDRIFGMNLAKIKEVFLQTYGQDFPYDEFYAKKNDKQLAIYQKDGAPMEPGLVELLMYAQNHGIVCAVASSSPLETVQLLLNKAGITMYFTLIQSGHGMAHSKPAPDIFLVVCEKLHVQPAQAMVFEDSGNGLLAAERAGIPAVWVPDLVHVAPEIAASAWHICRTLGDVPELLEALPVQSDSKA